MLVTWMVKDKIHIANSMPEVIISCCQNMTELMFFSLEDMFDKDVLILKVKVFWQEVKQNVVTFIILPLSLFLSLSLIFTCNTCTWTRIKVISLLPATNRHPDNLSYLKNNTCSARMMYENIIISVLLIK